jgi:hypothetical protein
MTDYSFIEQIPDYSSLEQDFFLANQRRLLNLVQQAAEAIRDNREELMLGKEIIMATCYKPQFWSPQLLDLLKRLLFAKGYKFRIRFGLLFKREWFELRISALDKKNLKRIDNLQLSETAGVLFDQVLNL